MAKLFTKEHLLKLRSNGNASRRAQDAERAEPDHFPVVRIFNPYGQGVWLLTELAEDDDTLFGLCCNGHRPELGTVSKTELEEMRLRPNIGLRDERGKRLAPSRERIAIDGLPLERDRHFDTNHRLTVWLEAAQKVGKITDDEMELVLAANKLNRSCHARKVRQLQQEKDAEELRQ